MHCFERQLQLHTPSRLGVWNLIRRGSQYGRRFDSKAFVFDGWLDVPSCPSLQNRASLSRRASKKESWNNSTVHTPYFPADHFSVQYGHRHVPVRGTRPRAPAKYLFFALSLRFERRQDIEWGCLYAGRPNCNVSPCRIEFATESRERKEARQQRPFPGIRFSLKTFS